MQRLSSPLGALRPYYNVVVIGSGYGGAIAASRAARMVRANGTPPSVCVLERGQEIQPGFYPDTAWGAFKEMQVSTGHRHFGRRTGLYDFRIFHDVSVFQGCGLGGTSLVNANVVIEPLREVFQSGEWPREITHDELKPYFQHARDMLRPAQYPRPQFPDPAQSAPEWPELPKLTALRDAAPTGARVIRPEIAVTFEAGPNHVGVMQRACTLCGDCCSGCNVAAKNTLIMNYLPDAKRHGAEIFCGISVRWIERRRWGTPGRNVWLVRYQLLDPGAARFGSPEMFVAADTVILGAGTLGSTEILLRSREHGLPVSNQLGERFTGNGDLISFAYNTDREINGIGVGSRPALEGTAVGPTIAGTIDLRQRDRGFLVQEGVIPSSLAVAARLFLPVAATITGSETESSLWELVRRWGRGAISFWTGAYRGALRRTQTYLVIGHDERGGRIELARDGARVKWPEAGFQEPLRKAREYLSTLAHRLGGRHVVSPFWGRVFGHRAMTVHPLGGCCLAEDAEHGVVNHRGQVFAGPVGTTVHGDLYVCDGSVMPRSLGANPLLTISALAERTADLLAHARAWRLDRSLDPMDLPPDAPERPRTAIGIRFSERMRGTYRPWGGGAPSPFEFTVTTTSDNLARFASRDEKPASMVGVAKAPGLSADPLVIHAGEFHLFAVDADRVETREMRYDMLLTTTDGTTYHFEAAKVIHDEPLKVDIWRDLSVMQFTVRQDSSGGPIIGTGDVQIPFRDLWRMAASAQITQARTVWERWRGMLRFIGYYATAIYRQFGWLIGPSDMVDPYRPDPRRPPRPNRPEAAECVSVVAADNADIELTRITSGGGGGQPVIVAPGYGMSTHCLRLSTVKQNISEFLTAAGYDVWLLDYRGSSRSAASAKQFTVDHIAWYDFPAAVRHVVQTVRNEKVVPDPRPQVVAHCLSSAALLMSLLDKRLYGDDGRLMVRSAVCSQFFTHVDQGRMNRIKATLPTAQLLWAMGYWPRRVGVAPHTLSPDMDARSPFVPKLWDRVLAFYPTKERCRNPVCRRVIALYGDVFRHDHLNAETHDAVYDMFDRTNVKIFYQIAHIIKHSKLVDSEGRDRYLRPANGKHLKLPITLLQSTGNTFFRPAGGERSLQWIRDNGVIGNSGHRDYKEMYRLVEIDGYGHLDTFIGKDAARDVFPAIVAELQRGDRLAKVWN